ncbi:hypothetical protein [Halomonas organivorans]|uniref:Toxin CptA n=1 Tax=Halomonas organivorans TaxID=257772 RepID=A0A7W5BVD1_9GAMM|nr:hypothetical protein [Halomonas organivorans]MBB3139754.1 hypothetical protein [Halomonas organivorans]
MPRPPITITIAPSRASLLAQCLVALGVVGWLGGYAPGWVTLLAASSLAALLLLDVRRCPAGQLRHQPRDGGVAQWAWRESGCQEWRETALRCDYLGPLLIGLRLDGRRLWLWPDSSDAESLRQLRRMLVSLP